MTSRSNPDWLTELIATEGDAPLIDAAQRDSLSTAIASANSPEPIDPRRHRQLLEAALGGAEDPLAPPSDRELEAAAATMSDPLVTSLRAAYTPSKVSPELERVLRVAAVSRLPSPRRRRLGRGAAAAFWGALAAAAVAVLWFSTTRTSVDAFRSDTRAQLNLMPVRSTGSMFTDSFANTTASERIDRIAQARERDLRENRYRLWGLP